MNPLEAIGKFFKKLGSLIVKGLGFAREHGLDDPTVKLALVWVKVAANKFVDNVDRREWVVSILVRRGLSESVARLAVEIAVQLWKAEQAYEAARAAAEAANQLPS